MIPSASPRAHFFSRSGHDSASSFPHWLRLAAVPGFLLMGGLAAAQSRLPVLHRLKLEPAAADVSTTAVSLRGEVQFTAEDTLRHCGIVLTGPGGDTIAGRFSLPGNLTVISGNAQEGVCAWDLEIPEGRAPGLWEVSVTLQDGMDGMTVQGGAGAPPLPAGSTATVTLNNSGITDSQPPVLTEALLAPAPVDVTGGQQTVTLRVTAVDDRDIFRISGSLTSPSGQHSVRFELGAESRIDGTGQSGTYGSAVIIPRFAEPGDWTVNYTVEDISGRITGYSAGDAGLPAGVQTVLPVRNTGPVDIGGPVLQSISTDSTTVDITGGPRNVALTATWQDTPAGLGWASVTLYHPDGRTLATRLLDMNFAGPEPVTPVTGSADFLIPAYLPAGHYSWQAQAWDSLSYQTTAGRDGSPFPGGFSGILTVVNTGEADQGPPAVSRLTVSPDSLATAALPAQVEVTVPATDDVGVREITVALENPVGSYDTFSLNRTGGTAKDGIWTGILPVPATFTPGSWLLGVQVVDVAGNRMTWGILHPVLDPVPAGSSTHLIITEGGGADAYTTWRNARPALAGTPGALNADPDGDGLPNAVEFLCGTDPLRSGLPGAGGTAADPDAGRGPVYTVTPAHLRVEYRLSAANAALGSGTDLALQPQSSPALAVPWQDLTAVNAGGDLWRAELPFAAGGPRHFLRLAVLP